MNDERSNGSVPLIPLSSSRRRDYARLSEDNDPYSYNDNDHDNDGSFHDHNNNYSSQKHNNLDIDTSYQGPRSYTYPQQEQLHHHHHHHDQQQQQQQPPTMMSNLRSAAGISKKGSISVMASYAFDWAIILIVLGIAYWWNDHEPNRRPFSLEDPNISFPFTEHETVPPWLLITLAIGLPTVVIPIICLVFVPGRTVPRGTPAGLVWRRKLWELHVGWLGLALAIAATWFVTNGMKNLFGKPRPDLLSRCNPDVANYDQYVVGGLDITAAGNGGYNRLVSAAICRGMDNHEDAQTLLEDGFRSYPSGHASSAAAGLIYLSLFIASKFAITFPFLAPGSHDLPATSFSAFPSRTHHHHHPHFPHHAAHASSSRSSPSPYPNQSPEPAGAALLTAHNARLASVRLQAAAPPLYLLLLAVAPFSTAVFIAASRWFDFRHHGFDILFGFLIGTICAFLAFRWYHLPVTRGAGWAWGPRCADKAWWAGVGSFSYAMDWEPDLAAAAAAAGGTTGADVLGGGGGGGLGGGVAGRARMRGDEESAMEEGRLGDTSKLR